MRRDNTPPAKEQVLRFMVFGGYEGSGQIDSRWARAHVSASAVAARDLGFCFILGAVVA